MTPLAMCAGSSDVALSRRTLPIDSATTTMTMRTRSAVPTLSGTRRGRLLDVGRDVEVALVHRVNLFHLRIGQRRMIRSGDEFVDLRLVVEVRQRGNDRGMRVEPHQRELSDR